MIRISNNHLVQSDLHINKYAYLCCDYCELIFEDLTPVTWELEYYFRGKSETYQYTFCCCNSCISQKPPINKLGPYLRAIKII